MARDPGGAVQRQVGVLFDAGAVGSWSDGALVERFLRRRDESAFAVLVERHGPMVLGVCRSVLRDEHEAHDAFQATFLVLVGRARGLWVRDSVGPWLHGVAWRVASRARAASARRLRHERRAALMADRPVGSVEGEAGRDESRALLHEEIGRLPERFRAAVVLCDLEGMTADQAAVRLGAPVGTVRSRLARGRDRLKARLIRRGVAPSAVAAVAAGTASASLVVPAGLAEATIRAAVGLAAAGTVPVRLAWLMKIRWGKEALMFKGLAATGIVIGLVAGAGGLAAQGPAGVPTREKGVGEAKPKPVAAAVGKEEMARGTSPATTKAASPPTADPRAERERLLGRWTVANVKLNGVDTKESEYTMARFEFDRGTGRIKIIGHPPSPFEYGIDPQAEPRAMRVGRTKTRPAVQVWWLYRWEGDHLVLAFNQAFDPPRRPKGFDDHDEAIPLILLDLVRDSEPPTEGELSSAPAPVAPASPTAVDPAAADRDRLLGRWTILKCLANGEEVVETDLALGAVTFSPDSFELSPRGGKAGTRFRYVIDPDAQPRAMRTLAENSTTSSWFLYAFEKSKLRLAFVDDAKPRRLKGFDDVDPKQPVLVLELVRAADPAPAAKADPVAADRDRLLGRWTVLAARKGGQDLDDEGLILATITFREDEIAFRMQHATKDESYTYRIDPEADPKALRVVPAGNPQKATWWIYAFEGGKLKVALDENHEKTRRPNGFNDAGESIVFLDLVRDAEPLKEAGAHRDAPAIKPTAAPARPSPSAEDEIRKLQGLWTIVATEANGEETVVAAGLKLLITGNTIFQLVPGQDKVDLAETMTFTLDPSTAPHAIDTARPGADPASAVRGIYRIDGGTLVLCAAKAGAHRPVGFETRPGTGENLVVLRRSKPAVKPGPAPTAPSPAPKPDVKPAIPSPARPSAGDQGAARPVETVPLSNAAFGPFWFLDRPQDMKPFRIGDKPGP